MVVSLQPPSEKELVMRRYNVSFVFGNALITTTVEALVEPDKIDEVYRFDVMYVETGREFLERLAKDLLFDDYDIETYNAQEVVIECEGEVL
jgi:hypothetical protein